MNRAKLAFLLLLILLPAILRVSVHPWNFAPIGALALFAGAYFRERRLAVAVPLAAMLLSDLAMGWHLGDWNYTFHASLPIVYACFALYAFVGMGLRSVWRSQSAKNPHEFRKVKAVTVPLAALSGATAFFLITNFAEWALYPTYPHTLQGLILCYEAAIPFFRPTLAGDLIFAAVFFGGYELMRSRVPAFEQSQLLYAE